MKNTININKLFITVLVILVLLLSNMVIVRASEVLSYPRDMYSVTDVNVVSEEDLESSVGNFVKNERVTVLGVSEDGTMYKVECGSTTGFVSKDALCWKEPEYIMSNEYNKSMYVTQSLKLRVEPSSSSEVYRTLMKYEKVKVVASVNNTVWSLVRVGDEEGYVHKGYLSSKKPEFTLTAMGKTLYCKESTKLKVKPNSSSKVKTTIIPKEKVKVLAKVDNKNWYKVECRNKVGYVYSKNFSSKKPSFVVSKVNKVVYSTKTSALRKGPSKSYDKKDTITSNEKIKVTAKVVGKDYYQVKYGKKTGYVYSKNFTSKKPKFVVKKVSKTRYPITKINIRKGPGTKYDKLYTISKNTKLKVTGDVVNSKWYRVTHKGKTGYVHGDYLSKSKVNYDIIKTYSDSTAKITVHKEWYQDAWVYAAHIQFKDYNRFKSTTAKGGYETTSSVANRVGAILAVNGPYMDGSYAVIRNDKVVYDRAIISDLAIYNDNTGKLANAGDLGLTGMYASTAVKKGLASDTFKFCNSTLVQYGANVANPDNWDRAQRTFMGTNGESGDIWVCVSDGRYNDGASAGLRKYQCASYLRKLGCEYGVMLDGGGSSTMVWKGTTLNAAHGNERAVKDFVYFR